MEVSRASLDVLEEVWKSVWKFITKESDFECLAGQQRPPPHLLVSDFSSLQYSRRFQMDVKNVTNPKLKMQGINLCNALPYCWLLIILAWMCTLVYVTVWPQTNTQVKFYWLCAL